MIIKFFELKKKKISEKKFYLLYGNNQGLIESTLETDLKPFLPKNINSLSEDEILGNLDNFKEDILNESFFENERLFIIKRTTEKFFKIIEEIIERDIKDLYFIFISGTLEKKSKIRNLFEKKSNLICTPFYEDNNETLKIVAQKFLIEKKIKISQQNINLIVERANKDRINLNNELSKLENLAKSKPQIDTDDIIKLTNLAENYSVSDLVDNSLAKNKRRTLNILNENNFAQEDIIKILRIFLIKLKRLLRIQKELNDNKNLDSVIASFKPPIFWKDKEIVKQQVKANSYRGLKELIIKVTDVELLVKKNPSISINIMIDFILDQTLITSN